MQEDRNTVLIVDDHAINREIIKRILEEEFQVCEASDGASALIFMKDNPDISAVLLDLVMPEMDGYQVLEQMRKLQMNELPVIVMTAEADKNSEEKALNLGAVDFIEKPVKPTVLMSRVHNAVIHNQMKLLEQMRFISSHDALTGLYNRRRMFEETRKMLSNHPEQKFVFMRYDIDRFRLYNSSLGEEEGDKLLCYMAEKIAETSRLFDICTYGRVDADVFCICEPFDKNKIQKQIKLARDFRLNYRDDYVIEASFGVYVIEDNEESVEVMYTKASMAAERCKHMHGMSVSYYEEQMWIQIREEQWVNREMKRALEQKQFEVYLQPKYDLKKNLPCGAEALVRWRHPEKGMIMPSKFIPVFETNGFVANLDYYMWNQVCEILHRWNQEGKRITPISVNMSRVSLYNPHITEIMKKLVKKYNIKPEWMQLEVTESAYMSNPDMMIDIVSSLQKAGFTILIDDFGSGYSSLNTLKNICVDILKIDMKFLPDGSNDVRSEKILSSIVRMAGWLGMPVIAEGVETLEQRDFLSSIGCGYIQGYFYAKPMPVPEYEALIDSVIELPRVREPIMKKEEAEAIWSSNPQIDELLKGITLPVMILEYSKGNIELVRANKAYIDKFEENAVDYFHSEVIREHKDCIRQMLERGKKNKDEAECEFGYFTSDGTPSWISMKAQLISFIEKSYMFCCTLTDITAEKRYKNQLMDLVDTLNLKIEKRKMLIIDDLKLSRTVLCELFQDKYEVIEAKNGKQGLTLLAEYCDDISVILLDMIMPEMGGEQFLVEKNKMKIAQNIPVIVISSEKASNIQLSMLKMGVNDYITKPFDPDLVMQRVENVIEYNSRFNSILLEYCTALEENS